MSGKGQYVNTALFFFPLLKSSILNYFKREFYPINIVIYIYYIDKIFLGGCNPVSIQLSSED